MPTWLREELLIHSTLLHGTIGTIHGVVHLYGRTMTGYELNYIALREVSLSYRMPQSIANKIGASNLSFVLTGRNLGYLLNSLPNNFNPESMRGTQSGQFMIRSVSPYTASYTFTISATF